MIRAVTNPDTELDAFVMAGGGSFYKEGGIPGEFKPEVFKMNWKTLIQIGMGMVWILEVDGKACGALGCLITDDLNDGKKVMSECFWYVTPEMRGSTHGVKLFFEMENYAAKIGVARISMVHYHATMDDRLKAFYEKRGYRSIETHYVKELSWQQ